MKYNLQNKMQIIYFLRACNNIDSDHVCHVVMYSIFLIRARDSDVWINYFGPMRQFRSRSAIFLTFSFLDVKCILTNIILSTICQMYNQTFSDVLHEILLCIIFIFPTEGNKSLRSIGAPSCSPAFFKGRKLCDFLFTTFLLEFLIGENFVSPS